MISTFNRLKRHYFDWRTWNYRYRNMKEYREKQLDSSQHSQEVPYLNKPGISFSFDDSFRVKDWYTYGKDLFGFYDVKVTFNINAFHHYEDGRELVQSEIDMLLDLQANGHELAHHGFRHKNAVVYSEQKGLRKWIEDEIDPLFEWMERQSHTQTGEKFKKPVTFAFPKFRYNEQVMQAIVPKYFKVARGHLKGDHLTSSNHTGFAPSICIDSHYLANPKNIKKVIKFAKESGSNLIVTCHSILPEGVSWEQFGWPMAEHERRWRVSPKIINYIINEARNNDMEFYTAAELGGVATFIDRNFEKHVRKLLCKPNDEWILISELCSIKELDLSKEKIMNLDGIQYFLSLERLKLSNNNITDFRLLEKLPKLVDILQPIGNDTKFFA